MSISAKDYISQLKPYQPGLPIEAVARKYGLHPEQIVKLASNENPLGMSPKARAALIWSLPEAHRYPDQYALTYALANKLGVDSENIVLGNGSNDVLDLVARTFLGEGDEAISSQYAFSVYPIATQSVGAANVIVPATEYGHDLSAMLLAITPSTKVIWLANPNNPTGTFIPYPRLKIFLAKVPKQIIVVLDEAYYEYLDANERANTTAWLQYHPNLVIARTFSKIYGLAGLRIGYGITSPEVAGLLSRVRQPFNANVPALAAAVAALQDEEFVERSYDGNKAGRLQLLSGLKTLGVECLPAYGNFVTCKVRDAVVVNEGLLNQGIIVRPLAGNGMPDWLRVTVGTQADNRRFLKALEKLQA
jgi:histidinol-phosphate aminotransferase